MNNLKKFFKSPLFRIITSILVIIIIGFLFHKVTWYGLPLHKTEMGRTDSRMVSCFLVTILLVLLYFSKRIALIISVLLLTTITIFVVTNWYHVSFYNDIILPKSFLYGLDALEGFKAVSSLGPIWIGIISIVGLPLLSFVSVKIWPLNTKKYFLIFFVLISLSTGLFHHYKFISSNKNLIPVCDAHPLAQFIREFMNDNDFRLDEKHLNAIAYIKNSNRDELNSAFPLYAANKTVSKSVYSKEPYNIILVVMESLRSSETGFLGGKNTTPNLDKISTQTISFKNFYSNAPQTVRAEMAILCSNFDFNRGPPLSEYSMKLRNICLPTILKSRGYSTHWYHGYTRDFFNREFFLPQTGIDNIHDDEVILKDMLNPENLGWGISDNSLVIHAMNELKSLQQPFFAEILMLSNHFPFKWDWEKTGLDFSEFENDGLLSDYHKGVFYTDFAVGKLWDIFKNSKLYHNTIVIFVSDHGAWIFDKDEKNNSNSFVINEKYFRVPFLLYIPNMQPQSLDTVASQLDIAPTLLSILGFDDKTAFLGSDMLQANDKKTFTIMTSMNGSSFREDDIACYQTNDACVDKSFGHRCDLSDKNNYYTCGVANQNNQNYGEPVDINSHISIALNYKDLIVEYSNNALVNGFTPALER